MKLLTEELEKQIPPLYAVEKQKDPIVIAKFFTPWSFWTWYVLEYDPKDRLFFGYVAGFEKEMGYGKWGQKTRWACPRDEWPFFSIF